MKTTQNLRACITAIENYLIKVEPIKAWYAVA